MADMDPKLVAKILAVLERDDLLRSVEGPANQWISDHGLALVNKYHKNSVEWLAHVLARSPELEPLDDDTRMFIWVVATKVFDFRQQSMTPHEFSCWCFSLISLGYLMCKEGIDGQYQSPTGDSSLPLPGET